MVKSALCNAAGFVLRSETKKQADWFRGSKTELRLFFKERRRLHNLCLSIKCEKDEEVCCSTLKVAKNVWFQMEVPKSKGGGMVARWFGDALDMQHGRREPVQVFVAVMKDEDGNTCNIPEQEQ